MMIDWLSIGTSAVALTISVWTFWATLLKRGTIRMTRPTTIFFGPDASPNDRSAKVYMRFLLFSTSRRGRVLESLHVKVKSPEATQNFPVWVYGNKDLARGSGLFVGPEGVAANHHFLLPKMVTSFQFVAGLNRVEIVGRLVGDRSDRTLGEFEVNLNNDQANAIKADGNGIYFDWGGDTKEYVGFIDEKPSAAQLPDLSPSLLAMILDELKKK